MKYRAFILLALLVPAVCSCEGFEFIPSPENSVTRDDNGKKDVFENAGIPEFHITVPLDQWNTLLAKYDKNSKTKAYVSCDVVYIDEKDHVEIKDAGLRLRGNTSRRRPEGWVGQQHQTNADWHHCHFGLHFDKFSKDESHQVKGLRKVNLKWFKDDAVYAREVYCYDLFKRFGVWTAPNSTYCRLWLKVDGDSKETYFGVYELLESIDNRFIKARKDQFGDTKGNLWKCRHGANLASTDAYFGKDDGSDKEFIYEFKSDDNDFNAAKEQLKDFILKLTGKGEESFHTWIQEVCDVPLLLRTYAVNVTVGMWDDYWCNQNNYYIYFNSTDKYKYKFYFIPFDYDNTLGTSLMIDSGTQDPFHWGDDNNPLIARLLRFEDFRNIYRDALLELVDPDKALFYYTASMQRIRDWQDLVKDYIDNDTGEDCEIRDKPAGWGNRPNYRLLTEGPDNFFQVKTQTIINTCK